MEPKLNNMPEIKLEIKLEQSSVVAFITKAIEQLRYFKNKSNPTYSAYLVTIKIFPRYKKLNLYKKLKPYIEKRKEIKLLGSESFVKKKSDSISVNEREQFEARSKEQWRLRILCKGDRNIFENTYGYAP